MKEPSTLPDIQLSRDARNVPIEAVGVRELCLPLQVFEYNRPLVGTVARWNAAVSLAPELRGTHMSRFVEIIQEFSSSPVRNLDLSQLTSEIHQRLQCDSVEVSLSFTYFLQKEAPQTHALSTLAIPLGLELYSQARSVSHVLSMQIPSSNLCPCSKAIADQGAHNQRVYIRSRSAISDPESWSFSRVAGLINELERCGSSEVFPLLKRQDEKAVTEQQYENPKFVEDVVRDAALVLRGESSIVGFSVEVEALESIHSHNAWARQSEGVLPGERSFLSGNSGSYR